MESRHKSTDLNYNTRNAIENLATTTFRISNVRAFQCRTAHSGYFHFITVANDSL